MSAVAAPEQAERQPDPVGSACIPITRLTRIESLETRTAALEAQHVWLRVEQLDAELARQAKLLDSIVESIVDYVIGKDEGAT